MTSFSTRELAEQLSTALELDMIPIALARSARAPAGVRTFQGNVPSSCTFWRRAEQDVFYATAAQHFHCPVGAMVMGFDLPPEVNAELGRLVGFMADVDYLHEDEAARIPHLDGAAAGVVYGPLARFPIEPELVLLWLTAAQAMLLAEAGGTNRWTRPEPAGILGRPACAALPLAVHAGATLSLGCTGMRTYTEIAPDRMLGVLSAKEARTLAGALGKAAATNRAVQAFHLERKRSSAP